MASFKLKKCKECSREFKQYNSLNSYCSSECKSKNAKFPKKKQYVIPKVSDKRKEINKIYEKVRIEVLSEAKFKCFIEGCTNVANTVEHTAGRLGFYDDQARHDNIPLIIDKRFLKACCLHHNGELENNPELSKKYQISKIHGGAKN